MNKQRINTKEEIIRLGSELILSKGFNAFSYQDISSALKIKNAAVHYHFPAKNDLAISVIEKTIEELKSFIGFTHQKKMDEMQKLKAFFSIYEELHDEKKVCLVGSLSTDLITLDNAIKIKIKEFFNILLDWLISILKEGKHKGLLKFNVSPKAKALMIISNLAGSLQVARLSEKENFHLITNSILSELKQ